MTSLNKHLPLEVVNQNEALQEIECNKYRRLCNGSYEGEDKYELEDYPIVANYIKNFYLQALTIADVIDSELLSDENKRKVLDQCIGGWRIESISQFIIESLDK